MMFKKITICAALCLCWVMATAQNAYDALRFSQQYTEGTARSVAMGNAFTALGGDMGGITVNPASSAVYRYSEFIITPSVTNASTNTSYPYLGVSQPSAKTRAGISNFGFVGSYNTGREHAGLVSWSFGLVLTKQNNFTNSMKVFGRTNSSSWLSGLAYNTDGIYAPEMDINDGNNPFFSSNASWNSILGWNTSLLDTLPGTADQYIAATENLNGDLISVGGDLDQHFKSISVGNITEATINFGGNFSNKLFFGVNIGIHSIQYKYEEHYGEDAINFSQFNSGFKCFEAGYRYRAAGTGVNLKAGLIYLPTSWLRIGAGISTPTWMNLNEEWENNMQSQFSDGYSQNLSSPLGTYNYNLTAPFRWNVGAAATLGVLGVLSVDYESVNYTQARLNDGSSFYGYADENDDIQKLLAKQNIIRAGAEVNVSPAFALRAGYQYYSSPYANGSSDDARHVGSLGAGYSVKCGASDFFVDLAYQQLIKKNKEMFTLYSDTDIAAPVGESESSNWKLLLSLGFRF